uniref:alpha-N-acetylgalactosaminide alpha-2,6-sialyltransferase n=1 Tax=Salarias fasciatus TaxID=181472 RepID=A0A672H5U3_SALFA
MFRKAFLPNIRLFLHKDNINVSEWNRLSHFNKPLLLPRPGGDGCVRCAVVGTGGILNGSRMGQADKRLILMSFSNRVNGAMTTGFEADVGHRTSVYVHSAHSIVKSPQLLKKFGYKSAPHDEGIKYVMMPEAMKDFQWLEGLLKGTNVTSGPYCNQIQIRVFCFNFFLIAHRFLMSMKMESKHWSVVRPTNGAFTLFLALHTCDIVNTYGFMTDDYKKYSDYYVQKTVMKKNVHHAHHDYELELNLWKKLHERKIMKLYQRKKQKH